MIYYCYYPTLCTFVRYKSFMCTHKREAETKNNSRIMQSSSFILARSFLLEYFRKQNKCDLYATWFEMQHLLLGSVLVCFYDEAIKSWNFPCSSDGIIACLIQKYFRNNFRLKIKNLKNIEAKKNSAFSFKKGRIERNQSSSSSNIQYVVRNLLNTFNASGTTEHSSESEKKKH